MTFTFSFCMFNLDAHTSWTISRRCWRSKFELFEFSWIQWKRSVSSKLFRIFFCSHWHFTLFRCRRHKWLGNLVISLTQILLCSAPLTSIELKMMICFFLFFYKNINITERKTGNNHNIFNEQTFWKNKNKNQPIQLKTFVRNEFDHFSHSILLHNSDIRWE